MGHDRPRPGGRVQHPCLRHCHVTTAAESETHAFPEASVAPEPIGRARNVRHPLEPPSPDRTQGHPDEDERTAPRS
jgi:hypothetical protein